jgi:conjugal transfer pilus assembly protein TraA
MDYVKSDAMKKLAMVVVVLGLCMVSVEALAGTADADFSAISTKLTDWATGTLGRVIALAMFIVGIATGILQQSVAAAVVGIGAALILNYGPAIITGLISATI